MLTYRARRGDSLWAISQQKLGDPLNWRRIWQYSNRRDVIARTGRGIPDPDLIYPDQHLLIQVLPGISAARDRRPDLAPSRCVRRALRPRPTGTA